MVTLLRKRIKPRGAPVNREELHLTFVGLRLLYPPHARFTGTTLQDLFAAICKRHKFESFEVHGDTGATFSSEGIRELQIERDRIVIEEDVTVAFDLLKRNFEDQVKEVQAALNIPAFFEPRIRIRALWPMEEAGTSAVDALRAALSLKQSDYDVLDVEAINSVGLVIDADLQEHSHMYLEITPYVRDRSQLHIEVESYSHQTLETPEVIAVRLQEFYDYYNKKVTGFIETFVH